MTLEKYTIFGERNSGTNYLKKVLQQHLKLKFTREYGWKHWYIKGVTPRGIENTTTDNECIKPITDSDDTLFVIIVRNVYTWVGSMYKKPHHIKNINKNSLFEFISNKYIAYEKGPGGHKEGTKTAWLKNSDHEYPYFMEEADNLIELRNLKNNHFYNIRNNVKHYFFIRQEFLHQDIKAMVKKFNLKHNPLNLSSYKKPKNYSLDNDSIFFIHQHLNNIIDGTVPSDDAECWKTPGNNVWSEGEKVSIHKNKIVKAAWYGIDRTHGFVVPIGNIYDGMIVNNNMGVGDPAHKVKKKLYLEFMNEDTIDT